MVKKLMEEPSDLIFLTQEEVEPAVPEEVETKVTDKETETLTTAKLLVEDHTVMRELFVTTEVETTEAEEMTEEMMEKAEEMVQETTTELMTEEVQETTTELTTEEVQETMPNMTERDQEEKEMKKVETVVETEVVREEETTTEVPEAEKEVEPEVETEVQTEVQTEVEPELKVARTKPQKSELHELVNVPSKVPSAIFDRYYMTICAF